MRTLNCSHPCTTTTDGTGRRSPRTEHVSARRVRPRLISDAVTAGYIHDISQRHGRSVPATRNQRLRNTPD
jgi:hypothetical protein